jgi:nitrite reductase/ring-hydroxylating ferredoxin subunit
VTAIRVGGAGEVPPGGLRLVEAEDRRVVLARVGDAVYACAHQGGPLSQGRLSGHRLACPWHGWMYDVRTGDCVFPGRGARVTTYPVRVEDGVLWLDVS